jgi:hypothetical protein
MGFDQFKQTVASFVLFKDGGDGYLEKVFQDGIRHKPLDEFAHLFIGK